MRNTLGHYIDSLSDDARDRILTAQRWAPGSLGYGSAPDTLRCLVGHAEYAVGDSCPVSESMLDLDTDNWRLRGPATRFDSLVRRFGLARVVRAIKLRAGSSLSLPLPESAREASGVAHG